MGILDRDIGKPEFWLNQSGRIVITERNPCGCHPNDYLIAWPRGIFFYSFDSRRQFKDFMNRHCLEPLK